MQKDKATWTRMSNELADLVVRAMGSGSNALIVVEAEFNKGGIENYVSWMDPKMRECYRVLKPTGTFYLHCDWHANYRLRMMLDEIFGLSHFQNEIIWKRTTAHVDTKGFGHVHDTILRYTKSDEFTWNPDGSSF